MTPRDDLRRRIETLFIDRQLAWNRQGRSPEMIWALENFRTGQGQLLMDDLAALAEREREKAVAEFECEIHGPGAMFCELCNLPTD